MIDLEPFLLHTFCPYYCLGSISILYHQIGLSVYTVIDLLKLVVTLLLAGNEINEENGNRENSYIRTTLYRLMLDKLIICLAVSDCRESSDVFKGKAMDG